MRLHPQIRQKTWAFNLDAGGNKVSGVGHKVAGGVNDKVKARFFSDKYIFYQPGSYWYS